MISDKLRLYNKLHPIIIDDRLVFGRVEVYIQYDNIVRRVFEKLSDIDTDLHDQVQQDMNKQKTNQ
jgi:hypothetical protein